MARDRIIGVRVDDAQSGQFERAATSAGKSVSEWLRDLGAIAVAPPTEVVRGNIAADSHTGPQRKLTAAELAATLPGVSLGGAVFGTAGDVVYVGDAPAESVKPWLPELQRLAAMWAEDPGSALEELQSKMTGVKPRGEFASWHMDKKVRGRFAAWLDEHCAMSTGW